MPSTAMKPMPAIFVGHGNPMNIVRHNQWTEGWQDFGAAIPRPRAILAVSAHWYIPATMVTAMEQPRTIHDFGGFPEDLYQIRYPAPGDLALALRVQELLASIAVELDEAWGLDHGTWSVLHHMFPKADIPVVQLSIDLSKPPAFHYDIGKKLTPLRDEGILILGSGNLVHNLRAYEWDRPDIEPFDWAIRFEQKILDLLQVGDDTKLIDYPALDPEAMHAVPTPDHYLPLLYVIGARRKDEVVSFPVAGFDGGTVSMLAIQFSGQEE